MDAVRLSRGRQARSKNVVAEHSVAARIRFVIAEAVSKAVPMLKGTYEALKEKRRAQLAAKKLRVCETVPLGEKRFVALVQVDGRRFLIGGASTSVSLLAELEDSSAFGDVISEKLNEQRESR